MLPRACFTAVALAFATALVWPGAGVAEDDTPPMLMISSWRCDFGEMDTLAEDWSTRGVNAARRAADDGSWMSAGVFYHAWADEWNVNYWAVGESIPELIAGQEACNEAFDEMYPDAPDLWDMCSEHKDGFYQFGTGAESEDIDDDGLALAISSWKCTDVDAVNEAWESYTLQRAQSVVDAGTWADAGVFYHAGAGPWNVHFHYIAKDIPAILDGWEALTGSMGEDAPDITQWCSTHKDGFYEFGPEVEAASD